MNSASFLNLKNDSTQQTESALKGFTLSIQINKTLDKSGVKNTIVTMIQLVQ